MQHLDLLLQHPHEHLQHAYETLRNICLQHVFATSEEGREHDVQPEKPAPGVATLDLVMSRAKVESRADGHDLPVGNGGIATPRCGEGQGMARRGGDRAQCD
jgi:hypothetical protein